VNESTTPKEPCTPETATSAALNFVHNIKEYAFDVVLKTAFDGTQVSEPIYVERLDLPNSGYYLVPFFGPHGLTAVVEVDASTAQVSKAAATPGSSKALPLSQADALSVARAAEPDLRSENTARLVWQPSKESPDSFLPLWVVGIGRASVFVDQAGRVWRKLTVNSKGG